ncbi:M16 family metallopeptidase [Aureispira anguillae]|uniref:Insulinase family protein n=1 Tax=Aureispira anguillae TaxID=2864201 RepID=A0A915YFJ2_9BACT|nr:M16 family metallopeptidase [Aureispira anguillae]BDS12212.1 insulinase family protein [Aureispira anguillae]
MNIKQIGLLALLLSWVGMSCNRNMQTKQNEDGTYAFEEVDGDPMGVKIYTLANGLKVYMSVYKDAPRIQTMIATRAGSKNDPADATGLAHYLEHMLFKGTSKIASLDWEKEKVLLKQISNLYEKHRSATPDERAAIYHQIDSLSGLAAQYVAANEYDKMVSSLGAEGTNAFTSLDRTVYINDIPSNEIEKWLKLESERFNELVLRLFHTELEAVYEEYNIAQGKDGRKVFAAFMKGLLPNHPYGTQTTIGTGEHLKTPSMKKIHDYFNTYYVPNNMSIILSGDFDPNEMVKMIEKYWGNFKSKRVPQWKKPAATTLTQTKSIDIFGKEKSNMQVGWLLDGAGSDDALKAQLAAGILYNRKAGLIDMNLLQKQVIGQRSAAGAWAANDYSFFYLYGEPRKGQNLDAVKDYMYKELERIKLGEFEDWMLEAVINNLEIQEIRKLESNSGRAFSMLDAFIFNHSWADACQKYKRMRAFSKQDIVDFVTAKFKKDNCVVVYKREGTDNNVQKVDKPQITPVSLNREVESIFRAGFDKIQSPRQQPVFLDYNGSITNQKLKTGVEMDYIKNHDNETFELAYIIEMGSNSDNVLPIALRYLKFLGTDKYTAQELQQEFFKLGLSFNVSVRSDVSYVTLVGLDRSFEKGVELFEHILAYAAANEDALKKMVGDLKKNRMDAKKDKRKILQQAMLSYAYYGYNSPFKARLNTSALDVLTTNDLIKRIKRLTSYEHKIFYYGSKTKEDVTAILDQHHNVPATPKPVEPARRFVQLPTDENKVVFVDYKGMPQVEILMISKGITSFDLEENTLSRLYNEYFGAGLSSIVFQEIRESRALAYSAYVFNSSPSKKDKAHYLRAFIGTQADKLKEAIPAMTGIIQEMPMSNDQVMNAVDAILKKIESERITGAEIFWDRRGNAQLGLDKDIRADEYQQFKALAKSETAVIEALKGFHADKIKGRKFTFLVLGDKDKLDMDYLKSLGKLEELSLEQVFGY